MIMWPKAKRAVSDATAAAIAAAAAARGAKAVGVFVDEDAVTITKRCRAAGIPVAQLHGDGARAALPGIPSDLEVVYVMHASLAGEILTAAPGGARRPEWLLVDGQQVGVGLWAIGAGDGQSRGGRAA
jgi:phosphoribosylanthranilate isomerase